MPAIGWRAQAPTRMRSNISIAQNTDERILTYIGFATRKLGRTDEAMGFYNRALTMNPNYSVARAYMGEGFLR